MPRPTLSVNTNQRNELEYEYELEQPHPHPQGDLRYDYDAHPYYAQHPYSHPPQYPHQQQYPQQQEQQQYLRPQAAHGHGDMPYELTVSPRNSLDTVYTTSYPADLKKGATPVPPVPALPSSPTSSSSSNESSKTNADAEDKEAPEASIRLLFSLLSRRHCLLLLTPAIFASLISGGIAPFMTYVVGQAFDAFAAYPLSSPTAEDKSALLHGVGMAAVSLVGLAFGSLALGSVTSCLWIWTGEVNVGEVRRRVYRGVMSREMGWFDNADARKVVAEGDGDEEDGEGEGPVGAAGLMAKFTKETDDVRQASSLASGLLIQHLTTTITCLILAFLRSWALTLVILASVPLLTLVQAFSQSIATPLLFAERHSISVSATHVERALSSIATVKAFNAQPFWLRRASGTFTTLLSLATKLSAVWGLSSGVAQFVMMAMFVQGFWFGGKLVREGKVSPGDVMAVFWACLIATSNLQMCIPQVILLAKGKLSMVALLEVAGDGGDEASSSSSLPPPPPYTNRPDSQVKSPDTATTLAPPLHGSPQTKHSRFASLVASQGHESHPPPPTRSKRRLRKITPARCHGELALHNVTFAYPTRPDVPVLKEVSMYLPAREMTFVVGSSGSGKSSVAALLLRMYDVCGPTSKTSTNSKLNSGHISLDEQDVLYLDERWVRSKVMGVTQSTCVILEGKTVFENVACVVSGEDGRPPVTLQEVEDACRAALIHDFIRDLPMGYDTILGSSSSFPSAKSKDDSEKVEDDNDDDGKKTTTGGGGGMATGVHLSGGQRQRLAFARARLRNPEVLILDEATSALDPTSRILVFEAMKVWRRNKTTIVITHDLSQIQQDDFVYVVKSGRVVEGGYRSDLEGVDIDVNDSFGDLVEGEEGAGRGEFRKMMHDQQLMGGCLPARELSPTPSDDSDYEYDDDEDDVDMGETDGEGKMEEEKERAKTTKHQSLLRPLTLGNWMFDVVAELVGPGPSSYAAQYGPHHPPPPASSQFLQPPPSAFGSKRGSKRHSGSNPSSVSNAMSLFPSSNTTSSYYTNQQRRHIGHIPPRADLSPVPERKRRPSSVHVESPVAASFGRIEHPYAASSLQQSYIPTEDGVVGEGGLGRTPSSRSRGRMSLQWVPTTPSSATFTLPYGGSRKSGYSAYPTDTNTVSSPRERHADSKYDEDEEDEKWKKEQEAFEKDKEAVKKSGGAASGVRSGRRRRAPGVKRVSQQRTALEVVVEKPREKGLKALVHRKRKGPQPQVTTTDDAGGDGNGEQEEQPPAFWALLRHIYPSIPSKPLLLFGLLVCIASGAITPTFSFLLSRLLFEVSIGAQNTHIINVFGGIVLGVAAMDGVLLGVKYFVMEVCGIRWVTEMRKKAFGNLVRQDMAWFEAGPTATGGGGRGGAGGNSPARLVQVVVKDAEDARNLIAVVIGQCFVVVTMLGVGLIWAMVRGWELTLVGVAVAPVFAVIMSVQTTLVGRCEVRNKRAREALAKSYYDSLINIRGIRAMSFEAHFTREFELGVGRALKTGVRGAFVEGCTYGVASGLIYLAEALLFYVGAVLIIKERYDYLQMVEVLNLVVFTVTIGSQLMAFTERIAKSVQATSDLYQLVDLSTSNTSESHGFLKPSPLSSSITLQNVSFTYPSRPSIPVLNNLNLHIKEGECVALVGASGCGKSTIANLLQRLYEPGVGGRRSAGAGSVSVGGWDVQDVDCRWLRERIAVVSQHPNLFDASVRENIRFGALPLESLDDALRGAARPEGEGEVTQEEIEEAARQANVHDFIVGLPQGYDTVLGENAGLVSGGQAQRIQIARALLRINKRGQGDGKILILDECTSALDPENQRVVMDTIRSVVDTYRRPAAASTSTGGRMTTVMVTHKVQVMQMCDRILVLEDGDVKEEGTFEELVRRKGVFARLASGGEWNGD